MTLNFPNLSRCYDATRHMVRFWGHDRSMEASFFVTEEALHRIQPDLEFNADGFLRAFDLHRDRIYAVAGRVYARSRRMSSYDLCASDF
jgi:hypothetical protein